MNAHLHSFDKEKLDELLTGAGCSVRNRVTFVNRVAERLGMAGFTCFLPQWTWRLMDRIACAILGRESFIAVRAVKDGT